MMVDSASTGSPATMNVELGHGRFPVARQVIVERRVTARDRLQAVVEIEHDLVQRQFVLQHHARRADVFEALLLAALFFDQLQNAADIFFVGQDDVRESPAPRSFAISLVSGQRDGLSTSINFAVGLV